jgi:crotonobetainyl-CoA:carnitine CoA-transferase CaiB-like acyl-CoA transferase
VENPGAAGLPLAGIRVIDLTRNLSGPYSTMMLGDMGAEVIKVESPAGDELRQLYQFPGRAAASEDFFAMFNRNKRSVVLDLKSAQGQVALRELLRDSQVFIQNLAPGAVGRLGFGYDAVRDINPAIVYVNISGFGSADPRRAYDGVAQAASGVMDQTGYMDGPPTLCGVQVGDLSAALFAAFSTVSALFLARATGQGTQIDVAMLDCLLALQTGVAAEYLATGTYSSRLGCETPHRVPYNIFPTLDDRYIFIVTNNEIWPRFCQALDLGDAKDDPRFATNQLRVLNRQLANLMITTRTSELTLDDLCQRLTTHNVPHSRVATVPEAIAERGSDQHGMVVKITDELRGNREPVRVMASPYRIDGRRMPVRLGPPALGEATSHLLDNTFGLTVE